MVTESTFDENLKHLEEWIAQQKNLPEKIACVVLRRYLHSVNNDLEEAKNLIEHSYTLRNKYPNIFQDRDPLDANMQKIYHVADLGIPMPSLTAQNYRVVLNRLIDHDPEKFDFDNVIKTVFLAADHRFCTLDEKLPFKVNDGDVPIFDMTGFSYRHIARLSLSTLRCYMKFTQEAFPVKLRKIHLINVSPVLNKVLLVLRPFMNSRVRNSMNFHLPNTATVFEDVPQELLPNEYGGKAGPICEIKKNFIKQIEANREYLTSDEHWKPREQNCSMKQLTNIESDLRSLSID